MNKEQTERAKALHNRIYEWRKNHTVQYGTLESILEVLPEGDFHWDDGDPGEANVYCCGERDCPQQWHESYWILEFKREGGKLEISVHNGDSDGNWDYDCGWEEGEDLIASGVAYRLGAEQSNDHFNGWAEYWLDAAVTGKDPCKQIFKTPDNWVEYCLDAAENNISYLEMTK